MTRLLVTTGALVSALLSVPAGIGAAADATWKTHQDQKCGVELKYPAAYSLEASGVPDACALWIKIGVREARGLRALFSLEISEMESPARPPHSSRDFALHVATARCTADGADGSTYCINGQVRSPFKTAQGFHGFEIHLTEVRETFSPKRIERRRREPIFTLDLSDDEVVRVLMASGEPTRLPEAGFGERFEDSAVKFDDLVVRRPVELPEPRTRRAVSPPSLHSDRRAALVPDSPDRRLPWTATPGQGHPSGQARLLARTTGQSAPAGYDT